MDFTIVFKMDNTLTYLIVFIFGFLIDLVNGTYCWYIHEDYFVRQTVYCASGCCRDYGDENEICCFEWTVGIILGICFAIVTVIAVLITLIICCVMAKKKRARTGVLLSSNQPHTAPNTLIYTGSASMHPYSYPHPPSGFYPASQFPNSAPQPIHNNAGSYPPDKDTNPAFPPPPSYSQVVPPSYTQATAPPGPQDPYGGYGTGAT